jgi:hypothetical protein
MRRGGGGSLRWIRGRVRSEVEIVRAEGIPARGDKSPEVGIYRGDTREMRWEYDGLETGFGGQIDGCYEGGRESHPHRSLCRHQTWRYRDEDDSKRASDTPHDTHERMRVSGGRHMGAGQESASTTDFMLEFLRL